MSQRKKTYTDYIHGEHWAELRLRMFNSFGRACQACDDKGGIRHVHHMVYREPLETCTLDDLMVLCCPCHGALHWWERRERGRVLPSSREDTRVIIGWILNSADYKRRMERRATRQAKHAAKPKVQSPKSGKRARKMARKAVRRAMDRMLTDNYSDATVEALIVEIGKARKLQLPSLLPAQLPVMPTQPPKKEKPQIPPRPIPDGIVFPPDGTRMQMTQAMRKAGMTEKGGYRKASIIALGVPWPPPGGWPSALYTPEQIRAFISAQ